MSWFRVLGIEPTSDERAIKRAYARLLKQTRPEDDPENFAVLRRAYEHGLVVASYRARAGDDDEEVEPEPSPAPEPAPETAAPPVEVAPAVAEKAEPERVASEPPDRVPELLEALDRLLQNPGLRASQEAWLRIFDDEALWGLEARERFEHGLFHALEGLALPRVAWRAIDETFRWSQDTQRLYRLFRSDEVDSVLGAITESLRPPAKSTPAPEPSSRFPGWALWIGVVITVNVLRSCHHFLQ